MMLSSRCLDRTSIGRLLLLNRTAPSALAIARRKLLDGPQWVTVGCDFVFDP
jgi:hypothetical protein